MIGVNLFLSIYTHLHSDQCFYNALVELVDLYLKIGVIEIGTAPGEGKKIIRGLGNISVREFSKVDKNQN